jgi:2-polyprenyl-3-methyl-5-hydroxy-6-metoxy-1,4-benzoquinol methylase
VNQRIKNESTKSESFSNDKENELEYTNCPLCESSNNRVVLTGKDYTYSLKEFTIVRCADCGLHFTNPRVKEKYIFQYYPPDYSSYRDIKDSKCFPRLKSWLARQFGSPHWEIVNILRSTGAKEILEVGPGNGNLLKFLKSNGFGVTGVERDQNCVERIRSHDIACHHGRLEVVHYEVKKVDAVIMCHVLEHLYEPQKILKIIRSLLKDRGIVYISIPNISSVEAKLFGPYWRGLDLPRHVFHYNPKTGSDLLTKAGFRIIRTKNLIFPSSFIESIGHKFTKRRQLPNYYYYPLYYFWKLLAPLHNKIIGSGVIGITAAK